MTKREALILTLAGSLATSGVGRYEEHRARAERLVDEVLADHAHELAEEIRRELPERVEKLTGNWAEIRTVSTAQHAADLIDPEVS